MDIIEDTVCVVLESDVVTTTAKQSSFTIDWEWYDDIVSKFDAVVTTKTNNSNDRMMKDLEQIFNDQYL